MGASRSRVSICALGVVFFMLVVGGEIGSVSGDDTGSRNCGFPAIFNFGDSNSDTGSASGARDEMLFPNGLDAGKKNKRIADGRLIIDFLAEALGLPYLNATVDSIGTSFKHGANFATGGTKIGPQMLWFMIPFNLDVQISQFLRLKSRTTAFYKQLSNNSNDRLIKSILPDPEVFSKALYTIDIGQNDIQFNFDWKPKATILDTYYTALQRLLDNGAKFLWVHNTGPFGCMGGEHEKLCKQDGSPCPEADEYGCIIYRNKAAREVNELMKDRINTLRSKYPDAVITFVDVYSAKYSLFRNPKSLGFDEAFKYCCGSSNSWCGLRKMEIAGISININGYEHAELITGACENPSKHISWDGVHYTEAANRIIASLIANGTFSDPPVPITEACHKQ